MTFCPVPRWVKRRLGVRKRVAVDDRHGHVQDELGGAVVLLEQDHLRLGEILLEAQDVAVIGAPPAVDGLVSVAHDEDIPGGTRPGV